MARGQGEFASEVGKVIKARFYSGIVVVTTLVFLLGCGSGANTNTAANTARTNGSNVSNAGPANQIAAGIPEQPVANADANTPGQGPIEMANKRKLVDTNPNGPILEPSRAAAPENSQFAYTMDKQGHFLEERYFVDNRYLTRAERTWLEPGQSTITVWLKNGKQVKIDGGQVRDLKNIPIETLLGLVGVKVAPQPPPKPEKNPDKIRTMKQIQ